MSSRCKLLVKHLYFLWIVTKIAIHTFVASKDLGHAAITLFEKQIVKRIIWIINHKLASWSKQSPQNLTIQIPIGRVVLK